MASANWPGTAGLPALAARAGHARKSIQLPFATVGGETDAPEVLWGTGSPEGAIVGTLGDVFVKTDATPGMYLKLSGVNTNTGWSALGGGGVVAPLTLSHTLTGAAATPTLTLNPTWNTTGSPIALLIDIVDTASGGDDDAAWVARSGGKVMAGCYLPKIDATASTMLGVGPFVAADHVSGRWNALFAYSWENDAALDLEVYTNTPGGYGVGPVASVYTITARGTPSSPTPAQNGDHLVNIIVGTQNGATYYYQPAYAVVATGTWSGSSQPFEQRFYTVAASSTTKVERFRVDATGTLTSGVDRVVLGTITVEQKLRDDSVTWNAGGVTFTGWKLNVTNTASSVSSKLVDVQVAGVSRLSLQPVTGSSVALMALTPGNNTPALGITSNYVTAAGSSESALTVTANMNTTGSPSLVYINAVNAGGAGASTQLLRVARDGGTQFSVLWEGNVGIAGGAAADVLVRIGTGTVPANVEEGLHVNTTLTAQGGLSHWVVNIIGGGVAGTYTTPAVYGIQIGTYVKAASQTITDWYGLDILSPPTATNKYAIRTGDGQWFKNSITHSVVLGNAALATTATDGFVYLPSCAGVPTGVPTSKTGVIPVVIDTTNLRLYAYLSGAWKQVTFA